MFVWSSHNLSSFTSIYEYSYKGRNMYINTFAYEFMYNVHQLCRVYSTKHESVITPPPPPQPSLRSVSPSHSPYDLVKHYLDHPASIKPNFSTIAYCQVPVIITLQNCCHCTVQVYTICGLPKSYSAFTCSASLVYTCTYVYSGHWHTNVHIYSVYCCKGADITHIAKYIYS